MKYKLNIKDITNAIFWKQKKGGGVKFDNAVNHGADLLVFSFGHISWITECNPIFCLLQRSSPDVKAEMFELLYQILHQNWRYFFKTSVLTSVQRGAAEDTMENEAQFTAAMQVCFCMSQ